MTETLYRSVGEWWTGNRFACDWTTYRVALADHLRMKSNRAVKSAWIVKSVRKQTIVKRWKADPELKETP